MIPVPWHIPPDNNLPISVNMKGYYFPQSCYVLWQKGFCKLSSSSLILCSCLPSSFFNTWNRIITMAIMSLSTNPIIFGLVSIVVFFLLIIGCISLLFCMPSNFLLVVRHYAFYLRYFCFRALFWNGVRLCEKFDPVRPCFYALLGRTKLV